MRTRDDVVLARVVGRKIASLTVAALLLVVLFGGTNLSAQAADSRPLVDVIVLEQNAIQTGPMNMIVGKQQLKFSLDKLGICWLACGPKWTSYCFNPEAKTILVRDYQTWKNGFFELKAQKRAQKRDELKLKETGKHEKVAGYNCRKAELIRTPSAPFNKGEPHKPYKAGIVWIAEKFPAPKELTQVMKNLVKVDVKEGMVLKFQVLKAGSYSVMETAYETLKVLSAKKPASFFDAPAGYRPVKSEMQLLMGDSMDGESDMDFLKKKP
ncbi:MAG: hypothetical protein Q8T09_14390 [Candidatus Melainabacteria bacterium]|nr:hypothetical protein [Candidatus Melainabacteria bacterium]